MLVIVLDIYRKIMPSCFWHFAMFIGPALPGTVEFHTHSLIEVKPEIYSIQRL